MRATLDPFGTYWSSARTLRYSASFAIFKTLADCCNFGVFKWYALVPMPATRSSHGRLLTGPQFSANGSLIPHL